MEQETHPSEWELAEFVFDELDPHVKRDSREAKEYALLIAIALHTVLEENQRTKQYQLCGEIISALIAAYQLAGRLRAGAAGRFKELLGKHALVLSVDRHV